MPKVKLRNKSLYFSIILVLLFFAASVILKIVDVGGFFKKSLTLNNPETSADILICEGWISEFYLNRVISEYHRGNYKALLVTGNGSFHYPVELYDQCELVIQGLTSDQEVNRFKIQVNGQNADDADSPLVEILRNDDLQLVSYIENRSNLEFETEWSDEDLLVISFVNGARNQEELNKCVKIRYVQLNNKRYYLRKNPIFIRDFEGEEIPNAYTNESTLSKYFMAHGIKEAYSITSSRQGFSKTYNAALDATNWMKANAYNSANVVSVGTHTRRTLACYSKASDEISVGMIAIPTNWRPSKRRILKEVIGIFTVKLVPRFLLNQKNEIKPTIKKLVEPFS